MAKTVVGVFRNMDHARMVVQELQDSGFDRQDISLITRDTRQGDQVRRETGVEDVAEGAAAGAGVGAVLGGTAGLLVGLGALAIPGVGPIIAAGPIAAALAGAGVGAAVGGLTGALVDMGVPETDAEYYAEGVSRGGILVSVKTEDHRAQYAADIMERHQPVDIRRGASAWDEFDTRGATYGTTGSESGSTYGTMGGESSRMGNLDFDQYEPDFRRHYNTSLGYSGHPYEHYRQAYRYGYTLHHNRGCNGDCNWDEVMPEARRDWERSHPDTLWEEVRDAIRHAFEYRYH